MAEKIYVYDTTLRDGSQGEGISLSVEDKLKIAARLDRLGVDYIEGGWPWANPKDMEFFLRAREIGWQRAKLAAFGRTRKPGGKAEEDANLLAIKRAGVKAATIFGKAWDLHVTAALETTLEENLAMIADSIAFLVAAGLEVIFDAEHFFDGFKANPDYALATLKAAAAAGASWVVLCDTNGGCLPGDVAAAVARVRQELQVPLGIHTHNDGDLAVANTLAAVTAGCRQVQGTINGFGERCGNANLCSVLPNLELKMGYQCLPPGQLSFLTEVSRYVSEIANVVPAGNQPFVGYSAFAHKGGIHVSAVLKASQTYEHIRPQLVGNERRILMSDQAGASNLRCKAEEMGLELSPEKEQALINGIKEMERQGYQFEGADASLELFLRKTTGEYRQPFEVEYVKTLVEKRPGQEAIAEAIVKLKVGDQVVHTAAEGNGPVNAMDNALRKALEEVFPAIGRMRLTDYKVRVLDEKDATSARVRVLIESRDGNSSWNTVGVSTNIIEASWEALLDSMEYALLKQSRELNKKAAAT
ncbi:citramalate synthase [Moorella sp. E308F]|jgi:2-isopropylmalate synthase|uniref:citramalate synthase n=1 Tax=unclassified Neomoorella TaxID=2676739 RepID=UPI0010FFB12F|nr:MULTISPECIES: citramalate synthase [unclassified Moorella (in: firmicutes)]MDK2895404.1 2-isopropylmalate synthase [Moorella sp. (in: firmicutes)]GEA14140.1 citramalate synthase [Moorella sp. E308F]GEA18475.1 citramalate synthase [Moorella sp. E306M]